MGGKGSGRRDGKPLRRPATSVEGRENQLIALAYDRAEQQIEDGIASAQVITHFLKLGSTREKLEQARLVNENLLLSAKIEQIQSGKRMEVLYEEALGAMREYKGQEIDEYDD